MGDGSMERSRLRKIKLILFITFVSSFFIFIAAGDRPVTAMRFITASEGREVLAFSQTSEGIFLVLSDTKQTTAYYLELEEKEPASVSLLYPGHVFPAGNTLGLLESDGMTVIVKYLQSDLSIDEENSLMFFAELDPGDPFAVDSTGLLYVSEGRGLEVYKHGEFDIIEAELMDVEFLASTPGSWIYAYSGGTLYRWQDKNSPWEQYECPCPKELVGEDAFLSEDGTVMVLDAGEVKPVLSGLEDSLCHVANETLYVADSLGTIQAYSLQGERIGGCTVDGKVLSLQDTGALVEKDDGLWYAKYQFLSPEVTPDPTASPSPKPTEVPENTPTATPIPEETPSPEPEATATPPAPTDEPISPTPGEEVPFYLERDWEGKTYIIVNADMSVRDLIRYKKPQAVLITEKSGKVIVEGRLKTGMAMDGIPIVVLGDSDGTGYVNYNDMYLAERRILDMEGFDTYEAFLASDMDFDGEFTIIDLVLLSEEIDRTKK